jgi:hypothetical protein
VTVGTTTTLRGILVLGMHRSGTSAVAGMLGDLGCRLPSDLMEASPMNPKGFSESTSISKLDDELMERLGSSWFDWRPLQIEEGSEPYQEFLPRAVDATTRAFGDADLAVLKDPRISRLVPFWEAVLGRTGRDVSYVHVHRDPREVVASLNTWAGYDPAYGELLWLRYVLDSEAATRHRPRAFVSYANVLADWAAEAERLADTLHLTWPHPAHQGDDGPAFVDGSLHRSLPTPLESVSPWTREAAAVFENWAAHGEDHDQHPVLDELRARLDEGSPGFARVVDQGRAADIRARRLAKSLNERDGDDVGAGPARSDLEEQVRTLRRELDAARDERGRTDTALDDARRELARTRGELAEVEGEREHVGRELTEARAQHALDSSELLDVRRSLESLSEDLAESRAQHELARLQLAEADARAGQLSESLAEERAERDRVEHALHEAQAELERLRVELQAVGRQRDQLQRQASAQLREGIAKVLPPKPSGSMGGRALPQGSRQLRQRIEELEQAHQEMLDSRSWRITAPLRRMSSALRRNEENV